MSLSEKMRCDYLIIGNSAAGVGAVEGIRSLDKEGSIIVVGSEGVPPYSRCLLTHYIGGKIDLKRLIYRPQKFYEVNKVRLLSGRTAKCVNGDANRVQLVGDDEITYRKMLLATGSSAVKYDLPGSELKGVHVLRTLEDAEGIMAELPTTKRVVVLGGGLVGINVAKALCAIGFKVHVVVSSPYILSQNTDVQGAAIIEDQLKEHGVTFLVSSDVREIHGEGRVRGVRLADGSDLACEMVIFAKGVRPNVELARSCGIKTRHGVEVNEYLCTSAPNVYCAGDAAEAANIIDGEPAVHAIWPAAVEQGRIAGMNMAGGKVPYAGSLAMNTVDFFGLPMATLGKSTTTAPVKGEEFMITYDRRKRIYRKVVISQGRVIGVILIGTVEGAGVYSGLMCTRVDVSKVRELLLRKDFDFGKLTDAMLAKER
ncbi:MAG TPA: FAD-dependent oxidoreductase [Methanomassiliicoccales archaeon]|nr:FAD-dependent oxidoreductase [Methanomassiliicoccales archaeon]